MSRSGGSRVRRTWPQRALITVNAFAVLAAAATAGAIAYSNDRVAQIERHYFASGVLASPDSASGDAQNFLIVGVDDASGLAADDDVVRDRPAGTRLTDTIMVLRLDPTDGTAAVLSFPRDLYVPIPGRGRARINAAFEVGGPELLVRTIDENFDIPVHHYLQVDFAGFRELIDVAGGIPVQFPHPTRSRQSVELDIPEAGCWVLGPRQALGFARVRKDYQVQDADGDWHTDPGGDFSRVERQQLLLQLAMRQGISRGARNLNTLRRLLDLGVANVALDDALELDSVVEMSRSFGSFEPSDLRTYTLPVDQAPRGGPAYLYLREEEAEPTLERFRGTPVDDAHSPATADPDDVVVQVRNGTGTSRQATEVTAALGDLGFSTVVPGDDVPPGFPTVVKYAPGAVTAALTVGARLADTPLYQEDGDVPAGVDVLVVTGSGWPGLAEAPRAPDVIEASGGAGVGDASSAEATTPRAVDGADPVTSDLAGAPAETGSSEPPEGTTDPGDLDDPSDPAFFRATAPPPGVDCRPTP